MRPPRCSGIYGSGHLRSGTAHLWPVLSCPGPAFGGSVSRRKSAPLTYLRRAGCPSTAQSRAVPRAGTSGRSSSLASPRLGTYPSTAHNMASPSTSPSLAGGGGGGAVLEDRLTTLLRGSRWGNYSCHSLKRGGAASCWNQKPELPYFKWWGAWASTGVAMRYATAFLDHGVLASLALPCLLDGRSGSLRWSIAYLFGVLLCLERTRQKSP